MAKGFAITFGGVLPTHTVKNVGEFLTILHQQGLARESIKKIEKTWASVFTVYRGHRKADQFRLLPKLFRLAKPILDMTMYINVSKDKEYSKEELELDALRRRERNLLSEFKRQSAPFLVNDPRHDLEWLALAQHYGLVTRLLDWSESPLTALFFAVEEEYLGTNQEVSSSDSVVWALTGTSLDDEDINQSLKQIDEIVENTGIRLYFPKHINTRFVAQQGCFSVHGFDSKYAVSLEESYITKQHKDQYALQKFIVPFKDRSRIKAELDSIGVNYLSLFPDLGGLCRKLNWLNE